MQILLAIIFTTAVLAFIALGVVALRVYAKQFITACKRFRKK